jgi:hypothetical protein
MQNSIVRHVEIFIKIENSLFIKPETFIFDTSVKLIYDISLINQALYFEIIFYFISDLNDLILIQFNRNNDFI